MGKFAPVFLAFLLNCFGVNIFRENTPGCEPLLSSLIFLLSVFLLLWEVRMYPCSLRKLSRHGMFILEFLLSAFFMEHIMTDFWYPLETSVAAFLPKVAHFEAEILKQGGWDCGGLFGFLQWDGTLVVASYVMSFFFLFGVLHATRLVDFRLLSCGFAVFVKDIACRIKKYKKRMLKSFSIKKKQTLRFGKGKAKSMDPCQSRENMSTFEVSDDDDGCLCNEEDDDYTSYCNLKKF